MDAECCLTGDTPFRTPLRQGIGGIGRQRQVQGSEQVAARHTHIIQNGVVMVEQTGERAADFSFSQTLTHRLQQTRRQSGLLSFVIKCRA